MTKVQSKKAVRDPMKNKKAANPEKWKTSGSKRRVVPNEKFSDTRGKKELEADGVPIRKGMGSRQNYWRGGVNLNFMFRFLQKCVGKKWDDVRSELLKKIPKKIKAYHDVIGRLVADDVEIVGKKIWDRRQSEFLGFDNFKSFYVHPVTGKLKWVGKEKVSFDEAFDDK